MSKFEEFNEEAARFELIEKMKLATSCEKVSMQALESHLILMDEYVKFVRDAGDYSELLYELEDEIARVLNDSFFREDRIGPNANTCPELFELILKYFDDDPNIEVVLACNPNIPDDVTRQLIDSDSYWEEDGTQQALARNRSEPWILEQLSRSEQDSVRYEIAINESTPPKILDSLISDTASCDWRVQEAKFGEAGAYRGYIRWAVIQNPSTEASTLNRLIDQELQPIDKDTDEILTRIAVELLKQ